MLLLTYVPHFGSHFTLEECATYNFLVLFTQDTSSTVGVSERY